jgi:hypothetical protein
MPASSRINDGSCEEWSIDTGTVKPCQLMMTISARRRRLGGRKPVEASGDGERASASSNVRKKSFVADCNFTSGTLRVIVSLFVSNAEQRRTTMRLSHVSQGFRPTVLDVSWLFTDADWNDWPTPLLDLWCQRARAQPLTICLDSLILYRRNEGEGPERQAL